MPMSSHNFLIQATRASPPGYAHDDEERRAIYGAALAQFDELISAAAAVGPASRPLPLFYALSQAGRAISAAHATGLWALGSHGLEAPELDQPLLEVKVKRHTAVSEEDRWVDSVTGVADATKGEVFAKGVTIGAVWASLPELFDLLPAAVNTPTPLTLVPYTETLNSPLFDGHNLHATVVFEGSLEQLVAHLAQYFPTCAAANVFDPFPGQPILPYHTTCGPGYRFWWPIGVDSPTVHNHVGLLHRIASGGTRFEPRWLRPSVGGVELSILLSWWVLLYGLSMLARYEPARWTTELDLDSSDIAAPLAELLEIGLDRVPELVLEALGNSAQRSAE